MSHARQLMAAIDLLLERLPGHQRPDPAELTASNVHPPLTCVATAVSVSQ